jgi:hypothetical protein
MVNESMAFQHVSTMDKEIYISLFVPMIVHTIIINQKHYKFYISKINSAQSSD